MLYLWLKALHIIFVITWFAALFYLPRLFVYHAMSTDAPSIERFKLMERKLYRGIMTPSAVLAVGFGLSLLWQAPQWLQQGWLHAKLALVAALIGYHIWCGRLLRVFRDDRTLALFAIVILVVVKPF